MILARRPIWVAVLAAYALLAVGLFWSTWQAPTTRVVGSYGDPFVCVWFMRWFAFSLTHGLNPFVTDFVNYPQGYNVLWNTPMPLAGWILAPVTLAAGPVLAYNIVITAALAMSAFAGFFVFSRYVENRLAAATGGLVYGFSPFMVTQAVGHWHMVMAVTPPLMLLLLDEIVVRDRRSPVRLGVLLGLLAVVQLLLGEEILASEVLTAAVGVAILAALYRHQVRARIGRVARALAVAAATALPLAAFPLWEQFFGPNHITGVLQVHNVYVTDLLNFVVPTGLQWLAPQAALDTSLRFTGNGSEWNGYLGLPLLLVVGYTAFRFWRLPLVRVASLLALAMAVLSLGPHLHVGGQDTPVRLPYVVIDHMPLFGNLLPNRLALYVALLVALLLAVSLDRLLRQPRNLARVVAAVCLLVVVLAPLLPRRPYRASPSNTPAFFTGGAAQRLRDGEVVLVAPYSGKPATVASLATPGTVDPLVWQAEAGLRFRIAEGYLFTAGPGGEARLGPEPFPLSSRMLGIFEGTVGSAPAANDIQQYRQDLRTHGVDSVIVGPMPHQDVMVGLFTAITGRPPEAVEGVFLWQDLGPAR